MKSSFTFFCLLLLATATVNHAIRPAAEEYWKQVMKDEPLPNSIKELVMVNGAGVDKKLRFVKDFDTTTNAIIYHTTRHAAVAKAAEQPDLP
ncbi:hypothetical protein LINPERPRIM_LOCUS9068 [Linum perenne]